MSRIKRLMLAVLFVVLLLPASVQALTVTPTPAEPTEPPVIITAFGNGSILDFVELYNQTDEPIHIKDWQVVVTFSGMALDGVTPLEMTAPIDLPDAWLLPETFITLERTQTPMAQTVGYWFDANMLLADFASARIDHIALYDQAKQSVTEVLIPTNTMGTQHWAQHKKRSNATITMSGVFATDYALKTTATTTYSDGVYVPPATTSGLAVLEILPNAHSCSPLETALDCGDYIKLYNPTNAQIDLSLYRLRTDSGGLKSSSTNTIWLDGILAPGAYRTILKRTTGEPIAITNTGGYAWLEDTHGAAKYEPIIAYPDASAESKKGMSWALKADGTWDWMPPAPDAPNYWPPAPVPTVITVTSNGLSDCGPGRERNPDTNRCRNIVTPTSTLVPCKEGQERNPETNRCRSISEAVASLLPCDEDEFRNPETNRCKKVASATTTLKPCGPGQERNLETNRCRKISLTAADIPKVNDVVTSQQAAATGWWVAGFALAAALLYALYEWRHDIRQKLDRATKRFTRSSE